MALHDLVVEGKQEPRVWSLTLLPSGAGPKGRRVAGSAVAAVPSVGVHILARSEETAKERDLGRLRRMRVHSAASRLSFRAPV